MFDKLSPTAYKRQKGKGKEHMTRLMVFKPTFASFDKKKIASRLSVKMIKSDIDSMIWRTADSCTGNRCQYTTTPQLYQ